MPTLQISITWTTNQGTPCWQEFNNDLAVLDKLDELVSEDEENPIYDVNIERVERTNRNVIIDTQRFAQQRPMDAYQGYGNYLYTFTSFFKEVSNDKPL